MRDINRHNFLEKYESIKKNIEDAKFISIDCEFTGLVENPLFKNRYVLLVPIISY